MKNLVMVLVVLLFTSNWMFAEEHEHADIKPTHDGVILQIPDEAGMLEFVHDDKKGEITIYVLSHEGKSKKISEAPKLNLFIKEGDKKTKKQIETTFKEANKKESDVFVAKDASLITEELEGRIAIKIGEKTYQVEIKHGHHDEKEEHHK